MKKVLRLCRVVVSLCFLLSFLNTASSQTFTPRPGVQISDRVFGYYEYLPEGYNPSAKQNYPLLIFVHGLGERGNGTTDLSKVLVNGTPKQMNNGTFPKSFKVNGQTFRFIAIIPQYSSSPGSGYGDMEQMINFAIKNYRVDTTRIYLTGLSMGGGAVWNYASSSVANSSRIAAVVPVCGSVAPTDLRCQIMAEANLPVWATHNEGDGTVPVKFTEGYVNGINNYKVPPIPRAKMTIFPVAGHDAWTKTYDLNFREDGLNVYEWMLQFDRGSEQRILPVSEVKLSASQMDNRVSLQWTTSGEINNRGFSVEKSSNGQRFDSIGYVASTGATSGSYHFDDQSIVAGRTFYRLKITGLTGEYSYSDIVPIDIRINDAISIFPNPVQGGNLNLRTGRSLQNAKLRIFDMAGKLVLDQVISGSGNHAIPVPLPNGMYSLILNENGAITFRQSFIKQ